MNLKPSNRFDFSKPLARKELLALLNTALIVKEYRFTRQGALAWLAIFPGDLYINYLLANALVGEGKHALARPILEKLVKSDPEFWQAQELLTIANSGNPGTVVTPRSHKTDWERAIEASQTALLNNQLEDAEQLALKAMQARPDSPIPAIHHIRVAHANNDFQIVQKLADTYHQKWPDCMQINLFLAEARIVNGDETHAVALLHQCVARDPAGQVPTRIWGPAFPYRPIWPDRMEIRFDLPIPTQLAMAMGWNQLVAGELKPAPLQDEALAGAQKGLDDDSDVSGDQVIIIVNPDDESSGFDDGSAIEVISNPISLDEDNAAIQGPTVDHHANQADCEEFYGEFTQEKEGETEEDKTASSLQDSLNQSDEVTTEHLLNVQEEFEKLAKKIKRPAVGRSDGRFPMYIIFSSRQGLEKQYGPDTAALLDEQMRALVLAIRKRTGWGALLYCPDDPAVTAALGIKSVQSIDPWKLKLSLTDLDHALAKRGEMIGTLLIVGGSDVIPFHHLPNPTEDSDTEVLSDNPYATSDENYFIPEWPVGRLPGPKGSDASLLLEALRRTVAYHGNSKKNHPFWYRNLFTRRLTHSLHNFLFNLGLVKGTRPSFAYTAQVWRSSSVEVFRPIGQSKSMLVCPPIQAGTWNNGKLPAYMGYFNLHGIEDAVEWYGQKKPDGDPKVPDYPVAISPKDIQNHRHAPGIIFSEACYGALIENKKEDEALTYKFLSNGTYSLVGSTGISYGSVATPLIAADLLGQYFWQEIHEGQTSGNALLRAKLKLAKEMNRRQGYLDGEDQKTLLSFVLYGDPLALLNEYRPMPKTIYRSKNHPVVKMISDVHQKEASLEKISSDMLVQVRRIVNDYLPGLRDAELHVIQQQCNCLKSNPQCGADQLKAKSVTQAAPHRYVVTLSKDVKTSRHVHHLYARMTLDPQGKMLKLTTSR